VALDYFHAYESEAGVLEVAGDGAGDVRMRSLELLKSCSSAQAYHQENQASSTAAPAGIRRNPPHTEAQH